MEGCVLTMVIIKRHWWDLIPASVPWWQPDERSSTDHCVVIMALRSSSNLAPNIHVTFSETAKDREVFVSVFYSILLLPASCLTILTLYKFVDFPICRTLRRLKFIMCKYTKCPKQSAKEEKKIIKKLAIKIQ